MSDTHDKVSVIIPSKNRSAYLADLLQDLNAQTLPPAEVIVVDQSDEPYQNLDCVHIIDKGTGPCRARNLGLAQCKGEFLVFLDDDIRIDPDFLQTLCSPIIKGNAKVVVGSMCNPDGKYLNSERTLWKKETSNWLLALTANPDFNGSCQALSFTTCCAAIHREVYEMIGRFDPFFDPDGAGEDREYGLRIFHAGYSILYEGKASVRHLGAPSGGRRKNSTGFKYLNILDANSVYIVAKYFGWSVFDDFCQSWLRSIIKKGGNRNILQIGRNYRKWVEARKHCKSIQEIKKNNNW